MSREAMKQEPVAWVSDSPTKGNGKQLHWTKSEAWRWSSNITPLYAAPPRKREWVGLTDDAIEEAWGNTPMMLNARDGGARKVFAHAIEAKLKELNT